MQNKIQQPYSLPDFPPSVSIEMTNLCNSKCRMCPRKYMTRPIGFIEEKLFKKIIDECAEHKSRVWLHVFGEILLHSQWEKFAQYAAKKDLPMLGVATNAISLTPENAKKILTAGFKRLQISIDGATKETYEHWRGVSAFNQVVQNTKYLFELKKKLKLREPIISLNVVLMKDTLPEIKEYVEFWRPFLNPNDFILGIQYDSWGGHEPESRRLIKIKNSPEQRLPCQRLWRMTVIYWNGDVIICDGDVNGVTKVGNCRKNSLKKIWQNKKYNQIRQKHINNNYQDLPLCSRCNEWYYGTEDRRFINLSSKDFNLSSLCF